MRAHHTLLPFVFCLFSVGSALAQTPGAEPVPGAEGKAPAVEQRTERIRIEDGGSRVDEVRVGGQTKSITVQPKAKVPEYEIVPTDGTRAPPAPRQGAESTTGPRVWNVMKF